MRICIPVADNSGLDSQLYDHFGSAPCFALVDTESGAVEVVQNTGHHRERGRCRPIAHVDVDRTDAVVCRGMGKRAVASLRKGNLDVYITAADTVREALEETRVGRLEKLSVKTACGGHGGRERHRGRATRTAKREKENA